MAWDTSPSPGPCPVCGNPLMATYGDDEETGFCPVHKAQTAAAVPEDSPETNAPENASSSALDDERDIAASRGATE